MGIWFDKACIDQNSIEIDLLSLPLFLSGCKKLLVLLGPTYLSRLWCVVELFTFVHMGGNIDRVEVIHVIQPDQSLHQSEAIRESIVNFDASWCECFSAVDKEKMLEIIMAAFGDMDSFNTVVRMLLCDNQDSI